MVAGAARQLASDGFKVGVLSSSGKGPALGDALGGLAGFTKLYADKYAAQNIRMNNVLPGFINSLPETQDRHARIPMGRYGKEEEVSSLIDWLASEGGGYVTGQN